MACVGGHRWNDRRRRSARADHDLVFVVKVFWPRLGVHDSALELGLPRPLRRVTLRVPIVSLAHPEEICGEADRLPSVRLNSLDRPAIVATRPLCRIDLMAITDMPAEVVLLDDFAHIGEDFCRGRDRRSDPRLEPVAEGIKIAI